MGNHELLGILEEQHQQELKNDINWQFKNKQIIKVSQIKMILTTKTVTTMSW